MEAALLAIIAGMVGYFGVRLESRLSTIVRLHLRHHPADVEEIRIGGSL